MADLGEEMSLRRLGAELRGPAAVLGAADGMTIITGLVAGMAVAGVAPHAIWHAALSGGLAELVGMASGKRQEDPDGGWTRAIACGIAAAGSCVIPAVPYAAGTGLWATAACVLLCAAVCAGVAWMRPEKGARAASQTVGLAVAAAVLCALAALI